jgi:hypothetical protein
VHWSCAVSREEPARFYGGSDEDDDRVLVVPGAARFLCFFPRPEINEPVDRGPRPGLPDRLHAVVVGDVSANLPYIPAGYP